MEHFALFDACKTGNLDTVKVLVKKGLNPRMNDDRALRIASSHGNLEIVEFLCEKCNANPAVMENNPLRNAAKHGHTRVVKYLCQTYPLIVDTSAWNNEAITWAKMNGHAEIVEFLVAHQKRRLPKNTILNYFKKRLR